MPTRRRAAILLFASTACDPSASSSGSSDPAKTDAAKTDTARTESATTDAPKTDVTKHAAAKTEAAKTEPAKADVAASATAKADASAGTKADAAPIEAVPAKPANALATIDANAVVGALSAEHANARWELDLRDSYRRTDQPGELRFASHAFTRAGTAYRFVLWSTSDATDEIGGALFSGTDGAWTPVWTVQPIVTEDEPPDEPRLPWLLPLADDRVAFVFAPSIVLCGAEDCKAEDDFVDTRFYEVGLGGATEILKVRGPGCVHASQRHEIAPDQCLVHTEPNAEAGAADIVVDVVLGRRKPRSTRYTLRDGAYVEIKR